MARRKHREGESLQKVLGVPALFSTAYGNVGSSIYYALGLVALWALGVTPVVFLLTGLLFVTTAWSYAEATAMVPEAGGSSSFGRRAFNEFVSFGAGWALMLDYIVTVAISAYFVPNYLAVFWPALKVQPYNSIGGIITIIALVGINVVGIKEAARLNIILALLDLGTQVLLMVMGVVLLLEPKMLIDQVHLGVAPTWTHLIYGISIGTIAYTGIETVSNMSEEAANPDKDVPRAINLVLDRRPRRLPRHLDDGSLGHAGQAQRARRRRQDRPDGAGGGRGQEQGRAQRAVRLQGRSAAGQRRQGRLHPGGAAAGQDLDHPGAEAGGGDVHAGRQDVHQALRLAARQRLQGRPRGGHRPLPARRPRLAARRSSCPGSASWPRRSCSSPRTPA